MTNVEAKHRPRLPRPSRRLFAVLAVLGPGLISANAGNDAGGVATYSAVGATFGFSLLWALVLITISLALIQEMAARMGAVTGKGLAELVRERLGVRVTAFVMATLLVANTGLVVSEFVGIGATSELLGIPRYLVVPVMAFLLWWLILRGSYPRVEKVFLAMTLVFFSYPIAERRPSGLERGRPSDHPTLGAAQRRLHHPLHRAGRDHHHPLHADLPSVGDRGTWRPA
jgi:Mn2+/Fe2+ NRAMP family transporter